MDENEMLAWPFQAMTFKTGTRDLLEKAVDDDDVAFEQKLDGTRCMILMDSSGNGPRFIQRNGAPLKHAASVIHVPAIAAALPQMPGGMRVILDGELMWDTGHYVVFDMPSCTGPLMSAVTPYAKFGRRRDRLEHLWTFLTQDDEEGRLKLVRHARTPEDKNLLAQSIKDINGEGVLVKRLDAPYSVGTRVTHSLKVKFTKTVDVIVISANLERNEGGNLSGSIRFCLLREGTPVWDEDVVPAWYGSCSAIGRGNVKPGDVIEVEYLAYMAGGGIREPRMVRVREDKDPVECTVAQFTEHSKAVL